MGNSQSQGLLQEIEETVRRLREYMFRLPEISMWSSDWSSNLVRRGNPRHNTIPTCPFSSSDVVASTGRCDHRGRVLCSKNCDIKIIVPEGAIRNGDEVTFYFATSLFGPFMLPSCHQNNLASPYYWIGVTGAYHFQKPVQVELEHFAVVTACDPSHFHLLSCEDDDESHTMRPVGVSLGAREEFDSGRSWFTYQVNHFCSYCLLHTGDCKPPVIGKIKALFLKPKNYQLLDHFTVEIWFSLPVSHCAQRNAELYTKKGMTLDIDYTCIFEASCDASSENYFRFNYIPNMDGWCLGHTSSEKVHTKQVNFYNYYTSMKHLKASEENSLYPPRFVIHVTKKSQCTKDLDTDIIVTLCKSEKVIKSKKIHLFVPISPTPTVVAVSPSLASVADLSNVDSLPRHRCDENKPTLKELITYYTRILHLWKQIAVELGIPRCDVSAIDLDNPKVSDKCYEMYDYWLNRGHRVCWCRFIQALYKVGLHHLAQEAANKHLKADKQLVTSCTSKLGNVKLASSKPDLHEMMKYLKLIPDIHLQEFVLCLLPKHTELIKGVGHNVDESREGIMKKICNAFLKEKNPSWIKIYRALKEAECDGLADVIEEHFLTARF